MVTKRNKFSPEREGQLFNNHIKFQKIFSGKLHFVFMDILLATFLAIIRGSIKWITLDNILDNFG
jgi:hypothetical protein